MADANTLIEQLRLILPGVHGWCTLEKARHLIDKILAAKPDLCVEIGVFGGSSLLPQGMALKALGKGKVIGIDPWTKDAALEEMKGDENKAWWSKIDMEDIYKHAQKNVKTYCPGFAELWRAKAEDVVTRFTDASIDVLHIDGNHSELLSCKDAELYLPKVKPGGFIFFDDIFWADGGTEVTTRKAILFLLEHCARLDLVGDCMLLQKN